MTSDRRRNRSRQASTTKPTSTGSSRSRSVKPSASTVHGADQPERKDAGLLRHPGPRAGCPRPHQPDQDQHRPELLPARHGQRRRTRRTIPARLPGQRKDHPDDPDHLAKAIHRRGCPQHPQHRADAPDQLHDRVQADHRAWHPPLRRQGILHHLRLREGLPAFQRSGVGRRTAGTGTMLEVRLPPCACAKSRAATMRRCAASGLASVRKSRAKSAASDPACARRRRRR